jgi:hypothetical protein
MTIFLRLIGNLGQVKETMGNNPVWNSCNVGEWIMLEKKHSNVITVYFHSKLVICIEREKSGYKTIKRTADVFNVVIFVFCCVSIFSVVKLYPHDMHFFLSKYPGFYRIDIQYITEKY